MLVCSVVHHHLIQTNQRHKASLIIESGEVFDSHHLACLFAYGANAIYPYLVYATLAEGISSGYFKSISYQKAVFNYITAVDQGLLKIMSKLEFLHSEVISDQSNLILLD